jgi:hypothetical protein
MGGFDGMTESGDQGQREGLSRMRQAVDELIRAERQMAFWAVDSAILIQNWIDMNDPRPQRVSLFRLNESLRKARWTA